MKLPYLENAYVPEAKIVRYLLNMDHPRGKEKAAFFTSFGFSVAQWQILANALLAHAATYDIENIMELPDRIHYVIEGELDTPDSRNPKVRIVWVIETASNAPRLVSAYPL